MFAQSCIELDYNFIGGAIDNSGNGNHGTVFGATLTSDRSSNPSSAYFFDGVDDYIDVTSTLSYDITSDGTYTMWFNIDSAATGHIRILDTRNPSFTQNSLHAWIDLPDGYVRIGTSGPPGSGIGGVKSFEYDFLPGQWYCFAFTHNSATNDVAAYVDGVELTTTTGYFTSFTHASGNFYIGLRSDFLSSEFFHGVIDDFRIYDCILTPTEISDYCAAQVSNEVVSEQDLASFGVYPNPVQSRLYIQSNVSYKSVELISVNGKRIATYGNVRYLDIETLSIGIYYLRILSDSGDVISTQSFVKQ